MTSDPVTIEIKGKEFPNLESRDGRSHPKSRYRHDLRFFFSVRAFPADALPRRSRRHHRDY